MMQELEEQMEKRAIANSMLEQKADVHMQSEEEEKREPAEV